MVSLFGGIYLGWALGANDAANVFGTAVASRIIPFRRAALLSALAIIVGAALQGERGIHTLSGLTQQTTATLVIVTLAAAVTVTIMTTVRLPISTSQAIVGAIAGIGLATGDLYTGGFAYRQGSGGVLVNTYLELSQRPQTNCGGAPLAIHLIPDVLPTGVWEDSPTLEVTPVSTAGGLGLLAYFESSAPFAVCFDDVYMGIDLPHVSLIFRDGFEDGSTNAWSTTSP